MSRESIKENIEKIKRDLNPDTTLCVVTKYHTLEETEDVIENGITDLGENKVQDLIKKIEAIDKPVHWHMIGHLQTNKVKYIIGKVYLIQSVDSIKILKKIDQESKKHNVITSVLIQYNLTGENQKYGFSEEDTESWLEAIKQLENIEVRGIMGMGPNTDNQDAIREVFHKLKQIYDKIDSNIDQDRVHMDFLSMGMSGDYNLALEEGANMVRIGSKVFI